jgi:hypothetical protein
LRRDINLPGAASTLAGGFDRYPPMPAIRPEVANGFGPPFRHVYYSVAGTANAVSDVVASTAATRFPCAALSSTALVSSSTNSGTPSVRSTDEIGEMLFQRRRYTCVEFLPPAA